MIIPIFNRHSSYFIKQIFFFQTYYGILLSVFDPIKKKTIVISKSKVCG